MVGVPFGQGLWIVLVKLFVRLFRSLFQYVDVPLGRGVVGCQFLGIHFHCCMFFGFRAFLSEDTTGELLAPVRLTASGYRAADC